MKRFQTRGRVRAYTHSYVGIINTSFYIYYKFVHACIYSHTHICICVSTSPFDNICQVCWASLTLNLTLNILHMHICIHKCTNTHTYIYIPALWTVLFDFVGPNSLKNQRANVLKSQLHSLLTRDYPQTL